MNNIAQYTNPKLISAQVASSNPAEVIAGLSNLLEHNGCLNDKESFVKAVLARENLSPTACTPGWALPHARLNNLPRLSFALARSSRPIQWIGNGGIQVHFVWLFAVPECETRNYLNLVAGLARLSQNGSLLERLNHASDEEAIFKTLREVSVRASTYDPGLMVEHR